MPVKAFDLQVKAFDMLVKPFDLQVEAFDMLVKPFDMLVEAFLSLSLQYKVLFEGVNGPKNCGYLKVIPGTYFLSYLILARKERLVKPKRAYIMEESEK
jgi:hypothetical protein